MDIRDVDWLTMGDKRGAQEFLKSRIKRPLFVLTISYTRTCEVPGITVAGSEPGMIRFTPAADAELLVHGRCKCIEGVPATPDGKPTPALITLAALTKGRIPCLIADAGSVVKPQVPYISLGCRGVAGNIRLERSLTRESVDAIFNNGKLLGKELSRLCDCLVLGESIPGGTTTALCFMTSMGIEAMGKVSSSMPKNPHHLKNLVVKEALSRAGVKSGELRKEPLEAVALFGDPMMVAVAGMVAGSSKVPVVLAGGTQMAAVALLIKATMKRDRKTVIATTSYIAKDRSSDIEGLIQQIGGIPLVALDLGFSKSSKPGLRAYSEGFVKEGVGAGGASLVCLLKLRRRATSEDLRNSIEMMYERIIEKEIVSKP